MRRHTDRVHSEIAEVKQCGMCEKVYSQQGALDLHIKSKHREERIPCNQCDSTFSNVSSLYTHRKRIHVGRTFPCNYCPRKLSEKRSLEKHIESKHKLGSQIHEEKSYICKLCPYNTHNENLTNMPKAIGLNRDTSASFAASHWPALNLSPAICYTIQTLLQRTINVQIALFTAPTKQDL